MTAESRGFVVVFAELQLGLLLFFSLVICLRILPVENRHRVAAVAYLLI